MGCGCETSTSRMRSALGSEKYAYKARWLSCLRRLSRGPGAKQAEALCMVGRSFNIALRGPGHPRPWPSGRQRHHGPSGRRRAPALRAGALKGDRLHDVFRVFFSGGKRAQRRGIWSWWGLPQRRLGTATGAGGSITFYLTDDLITLWRHGCCHRPSGPRQHPTSDHAPVRGESASAEEDID